jgi:hypothetical protein
VLVDYSILVVQGVMDDPNELSSFARMQAAATHIGRWKSEGRGCFPLLARVCSRKRAECLLGKLVGVTAEIVDGNTPSNTRKCTRDRIDFGTLDVVIVINCWTEGVDLLNLKSVFVIDASGSWKNTCQLALGALRVARHKHKTKATVAVLSVVPLGSTASDHDLDGQSLSGDLLRFLNQLAVLDSNLEDALRSRGKLKRPKEEEEKEEREEEEEGEKEKREKRDKTENMKEVTEREYDTLLDPCISCPFFLVCLSDNIFLTTIGSLAFCPPCFSSKSKAVLQIDLKDLRTAKRVKTKLDVALKQLGLMVPGRQLIEKNAGMSKEELVETVGRMVREVLDEGEVRVEGYKAMASVSEEEIVTDKSIERKGGKDGTLYDLLRRNEVGEALETLKGLFQSLTNITAKSAVGSPLPVFPLEEVYFQLIGCSRSTDKCHLPRLGAHCRLAARRSHLRSITLAGGGLEAEGCSLCDSLCTYRMVISSIIEVAGTGEPVMTYYSALKTVLSKCVALPCFGDDMHSFDDGLRAILNEVACIRGGSGLARCSFFDKKQGFCDNIVSFAKFSCSMHQV